MPDPSSIELKRTLSSRGFEIYRTTDDGVHRTGWVRVVPAGDSVLAVRLTAPGLVTGMLLVFIPMMGEYVIPLILGGGRVDFIGNVIQRLFLEAQDYALGSALALLVMGALSFFVALYLYLSIRTEQEYGA